MKLRNRLLILLFSVGCLTLNAQDREFGISLNAANYQGDLSQKQVTFSQTKPSIGILYRYYFGPRIDIKGAFTYGKIAGNDADYADEFKYRGRRNINFKSNIFELAGTVELNILPFISNSKRYRFAPYVFGGVAFFHFNPKSEFNGKTYALQPLGTEGQNIAGSGLSKYSLYQFAIPYGLGIKYSLGKFWNIGLEIGQRKIFTDYLDDISGTYADPNKVADAAPSGSAEAAKYFAMPYAYSGNKVIKPGTQRGDKTDMDLYIFTGITITKTIRRFSCTGF